MVFTWILVDDEGEALPLVVLEIEAKPTVSLDDTIMWHAVFVKALSPPRQGLAAVNAETRSRDALAPSLFLWHMWPIKECEIIARAGNAVGVKQMIGADIVLIDRAFDQTHAECLGVKGVVLLDFGGHRREVVNACEL
jgi:hypothetical protein